MSLIERVQSVLAGIRVKRARWDAEVIYGKGSYSTINPESSVPHHYVSFGGRHVADVIGEGNAAFIADARTVCPLALGMLETLIEGHLEVMAEAAEDSHGERQLRIIAVNALTTLCEQWEARR